MNVVENLLERVKKITNTISNDRKSIHSTLATLHNEVAGGKYSLASYEAVTLTVIASEVDEALRQSYLTIDDCRQRLFNVIVEEADLDE